MLIIFFNCLNRITIAIIFGLVAIATSNQQYIGSVGKCPTNTPDCDLDLVKLFITCVFFQDDN